MGDKLRARAEAEAAGIPTAPGGAVETASEAMALGREIGPPLLVKAVGGGGGRGMKRVDRLEDLPAAMELAAAEAEAAFGDARVYLERFVTRGRHVEVQILGDGDGRVVHLGERDCSVQRRYQKLIEETPAPGSFRGFPGAHPRGSGAGLRSGCLIAVPARSNSSLICERDAFYFLEMNARIQVEHPITEAVTGLDLVAEQIAIADGRGLRFKQEDVRHRGCAIECRINAEDPARDFHPSPGTVRTAEWPSGEGSASRYPHFFGRSHSAFL